MLERRLNDNETLELVTEAYDAFSKGDLEPMLAMLASDVDWHSPGPTNVPIFGHWEGPSGVREYFTTLHEQIEHEQFEAKEYIVSRDTVVVLLYVRARVRATGRHYGHDAVHVLRLRDRQIVHRHAFSDTAQVMLAFNPPGGLAGKPSNSS